MFHRYSVLFGLSVTLSLSAAFPVNAQLTPDNTLGKENSLVTPSKLLQRIDGGAIRGSNLFHSFKEFNIDSGKSVYFSNPTAIENILTRVTGKNPSNIFGKLGVLGNANLFLLNPNGIIFGKDASLDISGSFSATTAESILFDNNFEFSATNRSSVPLLKVNITPGLQYPRSQQADITNQGNLTVGKDLNLIGKNLNLTGELEAGRDLNFKAQNNLKIRDNPNNAFIVDAGNNLLLQANQQIDIFALNHSDSGLFSGRDLILQSSNPVLGDARYFSGGSFRIEKLNGSLGDLESPNDPIIRASGDVSFDSYNGASLHILAGRSVKITGDVTITDADGANGLEETVTLSDGETLEINGKNQATLDIRAGTTAFGTLGVIGNGSFSPGNPNTGGSGSGSDIFIGGDIRVDSADGLVFLTNQYNPNTNLSGGNIRVKGNINTSSFDGNGGEIIFDSRNNIDIISSQITTNSSTLSSGNIFLNSSGIISLVDGSSLKSESDQNPGGNLTLLGHINLNAISIILDNSEISATTRDSEAGDIILNAYDEVKISNNSKVASGAVGLGEAGFINIFTDKLSINDKSQVTVSSLDTIQPGFISIKANDVTLTNKAEIFATTVSGNGGDIELENLKTLQLSDGSLISASTTNGISGNVNISATESINIDSGSGVIAEATGVGKAGNIAITTSQFSLDNNAIISVSNRGTGNAGELQVNASNMKLDNGAKIFAETQVETPLQDDGGDINLQNLKTLELDNGSSISASTKDGEGGDFIINATESVTVNRGSKLTAESTGNGEAGNLNISTPIFSIDNDSLVSVSSQGNGEAGDLKVTGGAVSVNNQSKIIAETPTGSGGEIDFLNIKSLLVSNNSLISASTKDGEAGDVTVNATDSIQIDSDSALGSQASSQGNAGFVILTADKLTLNDKGKVTVSSKGSGDAGFIFIEASEVNLTNQGIISATTESGIGGYILLEDLNYLKLNNSEISASTINGVAGDIDINAVDSIKLTGKAGLSVQSTEGGTAGSVTVETSRLDIKDEAKITVSSKLGQAGNLDITAENLFINQGILTAETGIGDGSEGANIMLDIRDLLLMRNNSLISAAAFDTANGGNITINNPEGFIIALPFENSDIIANANQGDGGDIDITTQNIFGLVFRDKNTYKSDITASSKFGLNGQVTVDQLNINPASGLIELPSTLVGATGIKAGCAASNGNNFVVSGKGGLPQNPDDLFSGETTYTDLFDLVPTEESSSNITNENINVNTDNQTNQIVEATGWVVDDVGNVIFVAKMPENNSHNSVLSSVDCESFSAEN